MGMGDQKPPYKPSYEPIRDDVIGKAFARCAMRECPEPHVIKKFGVGGVSHVSIYTCRRCKYHTEFKLHAGVGCSYGLDTDVQSGTEG